MLPTDNRLRFVRSSHHFGWAILGCLLIAGVVTLAVGNPTQVAAQAPEKKVNPKTEPAKPADPEDDDDAVRKAIEELKKGPPPRKEEPKEPAREVPLPGRGGDVIQEMQNRQIEMMRKLMQSMQQGGEKPGNIDEMNKALDDMIRQMQQNPVQGLGGGGRIIINPGFRNGGFAGPRALGEGRFGIRVEKPLPVLVDQLDLPAGKGMVVMEVRPDSAAEKAGIKVNDILVEIDGKVVSSDAQDFLRMTQEVKAETPVDVVLLRKGRKETMKGLKLPDSARQNPRNQIVPLPIPPALPFPPAFAPNADAETITNSATMSMQRNGNGFTVSLTQNDLKATITGTVADGKATASRIIIDDDGKQIKAESVEKLDPKYRKLVEKALLGIR